MFISRKKSVGLDISDQTIEVVELVKSGSSFKIVNSGRVSLESGVVVRGRIKDSEKLAKAVKLVLRGAKPKPITEKDIAFGLPESQIYTHVFTAKPHSKKERDEVVQNEVESNIPVSKKDLLYSYKTLKDGPTGVEILLVAASRAACQEWINFFKKIKLEIEHFDLEPLALRRSIFRKGKNKLGSSMLVDMGAATTSVSVFDQTGLTYSYAINIAGYKFTKAIAKNFSLKEIGAEAKKKEVDLNNIDDSLTTVLIKELEPIVRELKKSITFIKEKNGVEIKEVVLIGGSAQIKGLVEYLKINLGLLVRLGQSDLIKGEANPLVYLGAIGLALREMESVWEKIDPVLVYRVQKVKSEKKRKAEPRLSMIEEEDESTGKKIKSQKIILIIILVIGVLGVVLAFWFRGYDENKRTEKLQSTIIAYSKTQTINVKAPVSLEVYPGANKARGRIVSNIIEDESNYNQAVAASKKLVEKDLKTGEKLWSEPVNAINQDAITFPLEVQWLVYSELDVNRLLLQEINNLNKEKITFDLNKIELISLESSESSDLYYIQGKVTVSLNDLIDVSATQ